MTGTARPERIDQVIPAIIEHDAVSNHTFEAQRLFRELGFTSEIYAAIHGPGTEGRVRRIAELPEIGGGRQWLLYQSSIGSPVAEIFARHRAPKLLNYHNITPAELVERWLPPLADEARLGREQLPMLAPLVHAALADSAYNGEELTASGFRDVTVVPVLIDAANLGAAADVATLDRLAQAKRGGGADWLFVGQLAAHKAQHDVIKAFACYRRIYDDRARLHLVGREMGHAYHDALVRFVRALDLREAVDFTGSVSPGALVAHYERADVFVCCSDHEGYSAPLVEAMARGVPVVAYRAGAVPGTVGSGGVLLADKAPAIVASAVNEVLVDPERREQLRAAARQQATRHTLEGAREAFRSAIGAALERPVQEARQALA